ncbi:MAG: hypothetical protein V1816_10770 [Pseudomonadota bacterium]
MLYEGNDKHKRPFQRGRKGSLCPKEMSVTAQALLEDSILADDGKRYATCDGKGFCAQEHVSGCWHGYPVGWREIPEKLRRNWLAQEKISKNDIRQNW